MFHAAILPHSAGSGGENSHGGEYPGRGASANPSNSGGFGGVGGAQGKRAGDYPPRTFPARPGAIFARFADSGSPPSASTRPASRSPESAQGANSPNALARGGGKQSRPAQQGKRFSARPSAFGGFGRMRGAGRVRGRRRAAAGSGRGMTSPRFAGRGRMIFSAISYYPKTLGRDAPFACRRPSGECPGRGASANPSNSGGFWGAGGAQGEKAGDYPPGHSQARRGAFFAPCRHRPPAFQGGESGFAAARNSAADNPAGSQASAKRGCIRASPAASRKICASTSPMKTRPTIRPNLSTPAGTTRTTPPAPRRSPRMAPVAAAAPGFPRSGASTAQKRILSVPRRIVSPSTTCQDAPAFSVSVRAGAFASARARTRARASAARAQA